MVLKGRILCFHIHSFHPVINIGTHTCTWPTEVTNLTSQIKTCRCIRIAIYREQMFIRLHIWSWGIRIHANKLLLSWLVFMRLFKPAHFNVSRLFCQPTPGPSLWDHDAKDIPNVPHFHTPCIIWKCEDHLSQELLLLITPG